MENKQWEIPKFENGGKALAKGEIVVTYHDFKRVVGDIIGIVKEFQTDERKTFEFGNMVIETYDEKTLVNAVVSEIINRINEKYGG